MGPPEEQFKQIINGFDIFIRKKEDVSASLVLKTCIENNVHAGAIEVEILNRNFRADTFLCYYRLDASGRLRGINTDPSDPNIGEIIKAQECSARLVGAIIQFWIEQPGSDY
jgi:hypothetical protein